MNRELVAGQPSWRIASDKVEAWLTEKGGHLGPISFQLDGRRVTPFAVAPWAEEGVSLHAVPAMLEVLRGDFFCMPFGANDVAYHGEMHPPHGESANERWTLESIDQSEDAGHIHASMETEVRPGRIDKYLTLRAGQMAVYQRHVISGMVGPMSLGHHAMLRFPDVAESGLLSTSPFVLGLTAPEQLESPDRGGRSMLKADASFADLGKVPTADGGFTDVSRYPARRRFEDLVMLVADRSHFPAWTAVAFPEEGYAWFGLKDPAVLRHTVLWLSNGGRSYPPWNDRHVNVMGLEEVTSYFHYGLEQSVADNPLSRSGYPTSVEMDSGHPLDVRYVMGLVPIAPDFGAVSRLEFDFERGLVRLHGSTGKTAATSIDLRFLRP